MAADSSERAWDLMDKISTCMLLTMAAGEVHARPMAGMVRREEDAVYFLTNFDSGKLTDITGNPAVQLLFVDPGSQRYVALKGRAEISDDRETIRALWTPFAKAWWDNPDDPDIRVVRVTPESAEFWDSPGKIASYAAMLAAAVTGTKPKAGANKTVAL
jgi:general stress protein 26